MIVGETFIAPRRTLYTRLGDGFGWAMVLASLGLALRVMLDWVDERTASRL